MQKQKVPPNFDKYRLEDNGIIMHNDKVYVPNFGDIRKMILKKMHDVPYAIDSGYQKTIVAIRKQ